MTYETVKLVGARAATIPLYVVGTRPSGTNRLQWTGGVIQGVDWRLAEVGYSRFGPGERYERTYDGLNLLVEHAYNSNWKQRVGYQGQWKSFHLLCRTTSNVSAETGRMTGIAPNIRVQDIDSLAALQTDLLGHFNTGSLKHALLFTAGASLRYTGSYVRANPTATRRYEEAAPKQIYAAFLSYGWRSGRLSHTLRLNGNNVFDKLVVGPDLNLSMGRQLIVTYTASFR